jgi:hypothetical protein
MRLALAMPVVAGLVLQGCAAIGGAEDWHDQPTHPALPSMHFVVAASDLPGACGHPKGARLLGCAHRVYDPPVCLVYTAANPAPWVMEHELKHCAGYDHGAPTRGSRAAAFEMPREGR